MSVTASRSINIAAVLMMLFIMVIVNMLASSRSSQVVKVIGQKNELLAKLEKDHEREKGRWGQINTPENLDRILPRLGMSMKYPRAEQIVRMDARGVPERGQISVARAERRRASQTLVAKSGSSAKSRPAQSRKRR